MEEDTKAMDEANRKVLDYVLYGDEEKPEEENARQIGIFMICAYLN